MRQIFISLLALLTVVGCGTQEKALPRVGVVGIGIECSTFSPARSDISMFRINYGDDILKSYPFFTDDSPLHDRATWLPTINAWATPGGMVVRECYDTLLNRSLELLKANMPYDAIFLDIHGAMSVEGLEDPEGDYITKIREVVGDDVLISASMDPHGCVSMRLAENCDILTSYRMSPHTDRYITRERAINNMLERLESGKGKPKYKAYVEVPILLPGEKTSTRVEPGASLYGAIPAIDEQEGVTDAAIWMSYPWADEPRNHAVVMVIGDDKGQVESGAKELATHFWNIRDSFEFVAPTTTLDKALALALKSDKKPYFVSDMGDNPTAGGAGDVTWTLTELLKHPQLKKRTGKRLIYASIPGPEVIEQALEVGEGGMVKAKAGAMVDDRYAPPVMIEGKVKKIQNDSDNPRVVVEMGAIDVIVTKSRAAYHYEKNFDDLDLKPREADIIVVKLGYLTEELYDMRADWTMAHTRGGVDQELEALPYKNLKRPIFPLDKDMEEPALEVQFVAISGSK